MNSLKFTLFVWCLCALGYAEHDLKKPLRGRPPWTMDQLFDVELARTAKLIPVKKKLVVETLKAELRHTAFIYAQNRELFSRRAIADFEYQTSYFHREMVKADLAVAEHDLTDSQIQAEEAQAFSLDALGQEGQEKPLVLLFVRHWQNEVEWANALIEKSKVAVAYRTYNYQRTEKLLKRNDASPAELSQDLVFVEAAKAALVEAKNRLEMATANLAEAKAQVERAEIK
jgi:hypothetical protein